jgi:hypothetical protein
MAIAQAPAPTRLPPAVPLAGATTTPVDDYRVSAERSHFGGRQDQVVYVGRDGATPASLPGEGNGDAADAIGSDAIDPSGIEGVGFQSACGGDPCCLPPPCVPTFWYGGIEATFFGTDVNNVGVSGQVIDTIATPVVDANFGTETNGLDSLYVAPRVLLGVQHGCWGVQGRYWHMRANETAHDPFVFAPGTFEGLQDVGFTVFNQLDAYTADLEGTYSFCVCDAKNTFSFGARYASASQTAGLDSFADVNDAASGQGIITSRGWSQTSADGAGITGGWVGRKPLFCRSCVHLIGGVRGSALFGSTHVAAETGVSEHTTSGGGAASTNAAVVSSNDTLFIGEVMGGLQWDYRVVCFPADAFFRIVAEYQHWNSDGGAANAGSFAGFGSSPNFSQSSVLASASGLDMDLYGFSIGTGFTW